MQNQLMNRLDRGSAKIQTAVICILAFIGVTNTQGQSVVVGPPILPPEPPMMTAATGDTNQVAGTSGSVSTSSGGGFQQYRNPFQWGPVVLHPHIGYGLSYGTGLQSQPGQQNNSAINTVSAGLGLDLGRHWEVGYTAGAAFYSDPKFKNSVDHLVTAHGHTAYEDWTFNLSQIVGITSDPLVETAQQTDLQKYSTSLGVGYVINSDFSAELSAGQELTSSANVANSAGSSSDWSLTGSLNYQLGPGLSTGLGLGWGYTKMAQGPDMTYENFNLHCSWQVARKVNLSVSGGAQLRQFLGSGQASLLSPNFGITLNYHPFNFTTVFLSASRDVSPSFFQNQVTENTSVNLGMSQRLFKRYYLNVNGGYGLSTYQDSAPGGTPGIHGREDSRLFFNVSLNTSFLKRGTASVFYSRSKNLSNSLGFGYTSDQTGLSLGYSY